MAVRTEYGENGSLAVFKAKRHMMSPDSIVKTAEGGRKSGRRVTWWVLPAS
jgi:hypothetical protein